MTETVNTSELTSKIITADNAIFSRIDCEINLIKTHPDAKLPTQAHDGDNCWDVYAAEDTIVPASKNDTTTNNVKVGHVVVPVGLKVAYITPGFGFVFRGRSGLGFKYGIQPHFGEIDNGYRGDLGVKLYNLTDVDYTVTKGDKIAQIKIEKNYNTVFNFTNDAVDSSRGEGGFGSSGR